MKQGRGEEWGERRVERGGVKQGREEEGGEIRAGRGGG